MTESRNNTSASRQASQMPEFPAATPFTKDNVAIDPEQKGSTKENVPTI